MPIAETGGYRAPETQQATIDVLHKLQEPGTNSVAYIQPSFALMWRQTNRPGVFFRRDGSPHGLYEAVKQTSGTFTFAAFLLDGEPNERHISFLSPSEHATLITLGQILRETQSPEEARKNFAAHTDRDTAFTTLGMHIDALNRSLRRIGIDNPTQHIDDLIDDTILAQASIADLLGGSWLQRRRMESLANDQAVILDLDEIWAARAQNHDGTPIQADMWNIHTPVPTTTDIAKLPPRFRRAQETLFESRLKNTDLIVVQTKRDAGRLEGIADSLNIPKNQRADTHVRNLMPPSFVDIQPKEANLDSAADFIRDAVHKGRIIAGAAQRLDPIKMDPIVLDGFEGLIRELSQSDRGHEILKNLRIAFLTETGAFANDQKVKVLFDPYADHVHARIDEINALFRQIMSEIGGPLDDDFILTHRGPDGKLTGYTHEQLIYDVYPFYNIAFQLGEEGLCQSVIEAQLVGTFGLTVPRPPTLVISRGLGYAEKAEDLGMPNVHIVEEPWNTREFTARFVDAYDMALTIRNNPASPLVEKIRQTTAAYGDLDGDSFYARALEALYEAQQGNA